MWLTVLDRFSSTTFSQPQSELTSPPPRLLPRPLTLLHLSLRKTPNIFHQVLPILPLHLHLPCLLPCTTRGDPNHLKSAPAFAVVAVMKLSDDRHCCSVKEWRMEMMKIGIKLLSSPLMSLKCLCSGHHLGLCWLQEKIAKGRLQSHSAVHFTICSTLSIHWPTVWNLSLIRTSPLSLQSAFLCTIDTLQVRM